MADPREKVSLNESPFVPPVVGAPQAQPTLGSLVQPAPVVGQPGPAPQTPADLQQKAAGWDSFFANPAVATALLQFGINLLQPNPIGQTTGGAIGSAVGAAGEAVGRVTKQKIETDLAYAKEEREERRVGLEGRRVAADEKRAQTDEQRAKDEATWRQQWLNIQQQQVRISAMSAGIAGAANSVARDRLEHDKNVAEERFKLERDKLAQEWVSKNLDRADKNDATLLSKMYDATMRQPRLPDEPPPDIGKIGQDFLTLRETLKAVKGANGDVFQLGTEQQWRQMLNDPTLRQQAIDTFGLDIVTKAEKKIQDIDKGTGAPAGGPR